MAIIGYMRVSTVHQKFDSQERALREYGVDVLYKERESGRKENRPILDDLLQKLNAGDTLVIFKLDRLARSTKQLLFLLDDFEKKILTLSVFKIILIPQPQLGNFFYRYGGLRRNGS
ncbi:recombinase family protein [Carnobacterium divergens]|uniref:recombinase family protein n=1 Tax=Carnobacterium divergens TaxID=2748 RepID=UPI000B030F1D|nr:recombinase family protein [Carnobacterium divergens]SUX16095.1 DNA-invertase hin [Carnobacterium divergens]